MRVLLFCMRFLLLWGGRTATTNRSWRRYRSGVNKKVGAAEMAYIVL